MSIFVTGATGFLGSYVVQCLLEESRERLALLVRARDERGAIDKLWRAMQLHRRPSEFAEVLDRVDFVFGDLTAPGLGIDEGSRKRVVRDVDSIVHITASLNRLSEKACLNTNLRGTLAVTRLAREIADGPGLRRFSHVSTVAVAGKRDREVVMEDTAIDWDRSDYDPYGRTKKFCEHMVRELLGDVPLTFFRPSIVMGDSRFPETSQFDMVRAFCVLADLPVIPFRGDVHLDIVNADFVGRAVARLHLKTKPKHDIYHLSSGTAAMTAEEVARALSKALNRRPRPFVPVLEGPFSAIVEGLNRFPRGNAISLTSALFKVFLPYITYDTVFDNTRVTRELGIAPTPFTEYCDGLYRFAKSVGFEYPFAPLSADLLDPTRKPKSNGRKRSRAAEAQR